MKSFWIREIVEVLAPATWIMSPKKLFVEAKRLALYLVVVAISYLTIDWLLVGVPQTVGSIFIALLVVIFIPSFFVRWVAMSSRIGKYNEYQ